MLSKTAQRALNAYGGESRWRSARGIWATVSAGGWAFRLKLQEPMRGLSVKLEIARPLVRFSRMDRTGTVSVLDGQDVRIESHDGTVLASRTNPRAKFPYGRRLFWWDPLDQAYFSGYALWNYLTLPALLLRDDIQWTEIADGTLEAKFPSHLPTHCERQQFHFDPATGLLRQHDYTAEVFGNWAKAANVVLQHAECDGLRFASRRRVTPRRRDGRPRRFPVLVAIAVHQWTLV